MKKNLTLALAVLLLVINVKGQNNTWITPSNYIAGAISDASFINVNQGWVVGSTGAIYTTTNGGGYLDWANF